MREEEMIIRDSDFKYVLQDTGAVYLGARFNYEELLEEEMIAFKLKTIISQYILKDVDSSTTLESHFYHMTADAFSYKTYCELKVKIKASIWEEKRSLTGKVKHCYKDRVYSLKEFEKLNPVRKKQLGIIVREIIFPKMGLMSFAV